jgi:biopolymer transport protein ExbD
MTGLNFESDADADADADAISAPPRVSFVPLIDVVLQIICFYLFVSAGVQSYSDSTIELPTMNTQALAGELPATLTINIAADGRMDLNGLPVELPELRARLVALSSPQAIVAIRVDRRQHYGVLDEVLQACKKADVPTVSIRSITTGVASEAGQ